MTDNDTYDVAIGPPCTRSLELGSPELERALDRTTGSIARTGNRVELLPSGLLTVAARRDVAAMARPGESLHQQTYVNRDDNAGWENAQLLMDHARIGTARHMSDAIGSRAARLRGRMFNAMRGAGVQVEELGARIDEMLRCNHRWHEKYFLLALRAGIIGGNNVGNEYAKGGIPGPLRIISRDEPFPLVRWKGWPGFKKPVTSIVAPRHDMDFLVRGPVLADMQKAFLRTWMGRGHDVAADEVAALTDPSLAQTFSDGVSVRFVEHRPFEDGDQHIQAAWVHLIDAARSSIVIESPYFAPPPLVLAALKRAATRGVEVTVLTSAIDAIDFKLSYHNYRSYYRELIEAGVAIYERSPLVHAKVMSIDDKVACGGSPNMNGRSWVRDSESMAIVNDPTLAKYVRAVVESVIDASTPVRYEDVAQPSLIARAKQTLGRALGRNF